MCRNIHVARMPGYRRRRSLNIFKGWGDGRRSSCPCIMRCRINILTDQGLTNYWGYNTIGFCAGHALRGVTRPWGGMCEFKTMVKTLQCRHRVILDVVYNHTAEGNHLGPTLSLSRHRQCGLPASWPTTPAITWTTLGVGTV